MGHRMFVAVRPPEHVVQALADFLEPRTGMPWTDPAQWHVTLAFMKSVPDAGADELVDRLAAAAARVQPFDATVRGAGTFPAPERASVLWLAVGPDQPLRRLATSARGAANASGAHPDGKAFVPHLTLARLRRPIEATKWVRVLDTFAAPPWPVEEVELIESHLGEGPRRRPRHETVAVLRLG